MDQLNVLCEVCLSEGWLNTVCALTGLSALIGRTCPSLLDNACAFLRRGSTLFISSLCTTIIISVVSSRVSCESSEIFAKSKREVLHSYKVGGPTPHAGGWLVGVVFQLCRRPHTTSG